MPESKISPTAPEFDDHYALEDDYAEVYMDAATYTAADWDLLDAALVDLHDRILEMSEEQLSVLKPEEFSDDVHRWAFARSHHRLGKKEEFLHITRALLDTPEDKKSDLLSYPDILLEYALTLGEKDPSGALSAMEEYDVLPSSDPIESVRYRALILLQDQKDQEARALLLGAIGEHSKTLPRTGLDFAEDLLTLGQSTLARDILAATQKQGEELQDVSLALEARDILSTLTAP